MSENNQSNIILLITAENKASQVLQQVQQEATKTEGEITKANQNIANSTQKVNASMLQTVSSFAALGAGAVGLVTSFSGLERAQVSAEAANRRLITAQASAEAAQKAYNAAVAKFGPDSEQVHIALLRLQAAQEQIPIAQDKARLAQENLTNTYLQFAANIAPQVISLIVGIQGASVRLASTSLSSLIPSIRGVGIAFTTAFITNPVGIVIIGITTVVILLATNVGGLRDKVVELGNQILSFIDVHLKPLGDAIRFLIDLFKPLANIFGVVMPQNIGVTQQSVTALEGVTIPAFTNIESQTVKLGTAIGTTMDRIKTKHKEVADGVEATLLRNLDNYGKFGRTAQLVYNDVSNSADTAKTRIVNAHAAIDSSIQKSITAYTQYKSVAQQVDIGGGMTNLVGAASAEALQAQASDAWYSGIYGSGAYQGALVASYSKYGYYSQSAAIASLRQQYPSASVTNPNDPNFNPANPFYHPVSAQAGLHTTLMEDTTILAHRGERVDISPASRGAGVHTLIVHFVAPDGSDLGSETLDLTNQAAKVRIKTRGRRLF